MKNNTEITETGLGIGTGTATVGSYGCVGDGLVCEQGAQARLPRGFSTLSAAPSSCAQGVSLCNHNTPEDIEKHAAKRQSNGGAAQRSYRTVSSAGNILDASEVGEKLTNCRCSEEMGNTDTHRAVVGKLTMRQCPRCHA